MIVLLRNFDDYNDVQPFDTASGRLSSGHSARTSAPSRVSGTFAVTNRFLTALYRDGAHLIVQHGSVRIPIEEGMRAHVRERGSETWLDIEQEGRVAGSVPVPNSKRPLPGFDPTPFVEEEHFDFARLLTNVMGDPARAARMFPNG
jgi:hypothetical protein